MLYKYVKTKPVSINRKDEKYKVPKKRNKSLVLTTFVLLMIGVFFIAFTVYPYAQAALAEASGESNRVSKSVLTSYASTESVIASDLYQKTNSYSSNVAQNFNRTNKALGIDPITHPELAGITGEMKITIPKLNLKRLPIIINVNSYDKSIYMPLLDSKLAHFKGTSLPDKDGNVFVYGHSANELWARTNPSFPGVAFTYLNKLDVGDEIIIEYNKKEYKYIMERAKMVAPEDISPIFTYSKKKTLTLMTCWPPGVGTERLIIIANQE